jgi:hypothetical protein
VLSVPSSSSIVVFVNPSVGSDIPDLYYISGTNTNLNGANAFYTYATAPTGLNYGTTTLPAPYSASFLADNKIATRIVSFGARVRYTGATLNRGGTAIWLNDTSSLGEQVLSSVQSSGTKMWIMISNWQNYPQSRFVNFNNNDTHDFVITDPRDATFQISGGDTNANTNPYSGDFWTNPFGADTGTDRPNPPAVLVLQNNTSSSSLEFTIELIKHMEYHGGTAQHFHTPSPVAEEHGRMVKSAYIAAAQTHSSEPDKHVAHHTADVLGSIQRTLVGFGKDVAMNAIHESLNPNNAAKLATGLAGMFL